MVKKQFLMTFILLIFSPLMNANEVQTDYSGEYQIELEIGGRIFLDRLILIKSSPSGSPTTYSGSYRVPDSFESKVLEFKVEKGHFEFKIHVVEGDDDYYSLFKGEITNLKINGSAFILPSLQLLGHFNGSLL